MELLKVNHVITAVRAMLDNLVTQGIIDDQDRRNLLPMVTLQVIKNESIDVGEV